MNNIDLNNKIAVVTGASQGFGYAISKRLVKSGAKVINIDKDPEATAEAKSKGDFDFSDIILRDNNYKDQILRYFQHNYKIYPIYKTEKNEIKNIFICKLFKNDEYIESGTGISKKKAEQNASMNALKKFHVLSK